MGSQEVLRVLKGRWLLIVLAALLGTSMGLIATVIQQPKYTASADVFVSVTSGQSTSDLAQGGTFSQGQASNFAAVVPKEIVLGPVISSLKLDMTVDDLRNDLDVEVPLNTSVITISVTNKNPVLAAKIANAIASQLPVTVSQLTPKVDDVKGAPIRAQLIGSAQVPTTPSAPIVPLYAMLGLLAGLVLSIGYLVIVELVVARVDSTEQVEAITHSTVLASVPRDRKIGRHPIAVTALPLSLRAESIRHARTALKYLPGDTNQTFVISSSVSGEGKSTTAANLAAAFAAEGLSTCLVEADLRRPRLEGLLDLTGGPGLSDIVVGQNRIDEVIQPWGPDNLNVILVGTVPPNASELLGSSRGHEALTEISERFDVTIIDTPPLTAVTDAALIGRLFGGVVLVVGGGKVRSSELRQAVSALNVADVPVRGALVNLAKDDASRPYAYTYSDRARKTKLSELLPQGWRPVIKVAAALVATIVVGAITIAMSIHPKDAVAEAATPITTVSTPAASAAAKTAVFIGDSLVQGTSGGKWVDSVANNMGWQAINLGRGGTGYASSSGPAGCGLDYCPTFAEMATAAINRAPDIVVVSGGQNDGTKDVTQGANSLFSQLRQGLPKARIIVISPLWRASAMPDSLKRISTEVKQAAKANGVEYVDVGNPLQGRPDLISSDGTHPTAAGYKVLANAITKALKEQ